jgi:hypothetical protein
MKEGMPVTRRLSKLIEVRGAKSLTYAMNQLRVMAPALDAAPAPGLVCFPL